MNESDEYPDTRSKIGNTYIWKETMPNQGIPVGRGNKAGIERPI